MKQLDQLRRVPSNVEVCADQPLSSGYEPTLVSYETVAGQEPSLTAEQQQRLLEIEKNFAEQREWRSLYLQGVQPGLDKVSDVQIALYRSDNPLRNDNPEGYQVRFWNGEQADWLWQDILNVETLVEIKKSKEHADNYEVTNRLIFKNGQTLELLFWNSFDGREGLKQEFGSARFTEFPETEFVSIAPPKVISPTRGTIPSPIQHIPIALSLEEQDLLKRQRIQNRERHKELRIKNAYHQRLGAGAVIRAL